MEKVTVDGCQRCESLVQVNSSQVIFIYKSVHRKRKTYLSSTELLTPTIQIAYTEHTHT